MNIFETLIVQPIFNLLVLIYSVIPGADFGVAIIILTIIIRFLLWPLVRNQLHQTRAMRKLQPELAKIRKKAKGNKQLEGMQMLELYKKHNIKPFRSILMLLIQLPIFIALYQVIRIFTTQRDQIGDFTYGFLENIPLIRNIIDNPSTFNEHLFGFIDLTQTAQQNWALVLLALIAAITQFYMSKQTMPQQENKKRMRDLLAEAGEGKQPDQAEMNAIVMQKMMKILPVMMFFIMIFLPGALALYYATSNIVAVIQQRIILKKDEDELEAIAAEKPAKKSTASEKAKHAKEATVVKPATKKKPAPKKKSRDTIDSKANVTRITAKDTKR